MLTNKPYLPLWYLMPFLLFAFLVNRNKTIDIQLHDTYIVLASGHLGILLSILLVLFGGIYWLVRKKKLIRWMTRVHVLSMLILSVFLFFGLLLSNQSVRSYDHVSYQFIIRAVTYVLATLLLVNLIFVLNISIAIFRNQTNT
ncbi:MAG: cbb3-type cytochrome c oxidase subunit I [Bacteroidota bacterium]